MRKIDLTGKVFGQLTVVRDSPERDSSKYVKWLCLCECGNSSLVSSGYLRNGRITSCGCSGDGLLEMHGLSDDPLYTVWTLMKKRCYSINNINYDRYGGRGIKICASWLNSFTAFYTDVVTGYKSGLELDRIDNDGDYAPDNVRWVTHQQNSMNTASRKNTSSKYKGVYWNKGKDKWCTGIMKDGKKKHIGYFTSEDDAALAYNEAAKELFGEYANLNKL